MGKASGREHRQSGIGGVKCGMRHSRGSIPREVPSKWGEWKVAAGAKKKATGQGSIGKEAGGFPKKIPAGWGRTQCWATVGKGGA